MQALPEIPDQPAKTRISWKLIVGYLLLALPASLFIGGLLAVLMVMLTNTSNFEGASGYAAIGFFMVMSPFVYLLLSMTLLVLIKKKYPRTLLVMNWAFFVLSLILVFGFLIAIPL